jgi:PIN domain nuclease of toxin-antitoxin system
MCPRVPLDVHLACAAAGLPLIHRDPFDRVLVALAQAQGLTGSHVGREHRKVPGRENTLVMRGTSLTLQDEIHRS